MSDLHSYNPGHIDSWACQEHEGSLVRPNRFPDKTKGKRKEAIDMPMGDINISVNWFEVFALLFGLAAIPVFLPALAGAIVAVGLGKQPVWSCFLKGMSVGVMGLMVIVIGGLVTLSMGSTVLFLAFSSATVLACIAFTCHASSRAPEAGAVPKGDRHSSYW